jgi:hypothetical protein
MIRRRLWARRCDDGGTSLVLALIFVTVGSLVIMAVLALVDTNVRATIQLTSAASGTAAAEGAANIAINDLRDGTFGGISGTSCFSGGDPRLLDHFYQRPDGTWDSARVVCELDTANTINPIGTPTQALTTLDTTAPGLLGPFGIWVTNTLGGSAAGSLKVTGDIYSSSNIEVQKSSILIPASGNLTSSTSIRARLGCTSGSGLFNPPATCNTGGSGAPDPGYTVPPFTGLPNQTVPLCAPVMTFQPGRYTDFVNLTARTTSSLCQGVLQFLPGIYYFDFPTTVLTPMVPWTISAGTVIGGALRPGVTLGPGMALSNNCVSPLPIAPGPGWLAPAKTDGVTFVFSGGSQMVVSGSAKVELCGRYAGDSAPLAVYAQPTTGSLSNACNQTSWPCAAIVTTTPTAFVVQGTVYLPKRELVLTLNNASTQAFRGGAVVRRAWANTNRSATAAFPAVIETPVDQPRTVVLLSVFLCPQSTSCPTGQGQLLLRAKVAIVDPTKIPVAGKRQMTVLSWSLLG